MDIGVFTERLRKLRGERSQREVAEGIGITQQTYGRYENGARKPDLEIIEAMARYHEVSADYLLGLNEDPTPDYDMQIAVRKGIVLRQGVQAHLVGEGGREDLPCDGRIPVGDLGLFAG